MSEKREPRWGRGWLLGIAALILGVIVALGALGGSDDDAGSAEAIDGAGDPEAAIVGDRGEDEDDTAEGSGSDGSADADEANCSFADSVATLKVAPGVAAALTDAGAQASVIQPGQRSPSGGFELPVVTSKRINCGTLGEVIGHRGGVQLDRGNATLELRRLRLETEDGSITAFTDSETPEGVEAFSADLNAAESTNEDGVLTFTGIPVVLTEAGAEALNAGLGTTAFIGETPFGSLSIR